MPTSKKIKIKWKVDPVPTGPYSSFQHRSWPTAYYPNGNMAGFITNQEKGLGSIGSYSKKEAERTDLTLQVWVSLYDANGSGSFINRKFKATFSTLKDAKKHLEDYLEQYPQPYEKHQ